MKTHCKHGHEYTPDNTYISRQGARMCRACLRNNAQKQRDREPVRSNTLCACGCGNFTFVSNHHQPGVGWRKPTKFLPYHASKMDRAPFDARIDKSGGPDSCWVWTGPKYARGYGCCGRGYAHRVTYERSVGAIPKGQFVCHRCDNRLCCNPAHLFLGTARDNTQDMIAKGRHWRQQKHAAKQLLGQS